MSQQDLLTPARQVITVTQLNQEARRLLERGLGEIWVEGELSNFAQPASGHWYFSLKDKQAQVRCAMFRGNNRRVSFDPEQGDQVLVKARVSIYEARGDYQLICEHMEPAGEGALQRAFEQLKKQLNKEGLFDAAHKKPLPAWPKRVGVITSASGAALRDILHVLKRRFSALPVRVYPTSVQGAQAAKEICAALALAEKDDQCDILIMARGGGSLEDLFAFNDESLARAIYDCKIPIVTGIGHEIDFTIADFVADVRAPTPSAAAEVVTQETTAVTQKIYDLMSRAIRELDASWDEACGRYERCWQRLMGRAPSRELEQQILRSDDLNRRMMMAIHRKLERWAEKIQWPKRLLLKQHPQQRIDQANQRLYLAQRSLLRQLKLKHDSIAQAQASLGQKCSHLSTLMQQLHRQRELKMQQLSRSLLALNPQAVLQRGYAILQTDTDRPQVITDASVVTVGDSLRAQLASGQLKLTVKEK